ncbi:MAG: PIG-L deacetylase family protein [Promethearchaeota archaeon]
MKDIILGIGAHPDDLEFFTGGTIHQFCKEGKEVYYLITTNGQRGSLQSDADPQTIIIAREKEAREAADCLGVKDVIFLGYEDGFLDRIPNLELREKYIYYIRKLKPRLVITFDPWNPYEPHSDHRKTALAAFESCYFCHYPLFYPDQNYPPHFVAETWLFRTPNPNKWIPLTTKDIRVKVKALLAHTSQMKMLKQEVFGQLKAASVDISLIEQVDEKTLVDIFVRRTAEKAGNELGVKFAESFKVYKFGYVDDVTKILNSMS